MKAFVGLVVLAGISLVSAGNSNSPAEYFAQNFKWMEEIGKNGETVYQNLMKLDFHVSREIILNVTRQTMELMRMDGMIEDSDDDDPNCLQQFANWGSALLAGQLWPLEVFDAIGKINAGYGRGNFRSTGHFRQCVEIQRRTPITDQLLYQGKMCQVPFVSGFWLDYPIQIIPPDEAAFPIGNFIPDGLWIELGVCMPSTCNSTHMAWFMGFFGLFFNLQPAPIFLANDDLFCHTTDLPPLTWFEWVTLGIIIAGFAGVALATIIDIVCVKLDVRPASMTIVMSAFTNGRKLFSLRKNSDHIQCLYGIRALSLIWLMLGYRHFASVALPLINPLDFVLDFATNYFSPWVTSFLLAIDIILLVNGVHIAYNFFSKMERDGRVSIFKMYIHRYLKVTPYVAILIMLLLTLTQYSSDGPYFKLITETQKPACEEYFWSAVLHVQNYVNPDNICILHTFLLSVDMQLFWASPLLLFPLFFWGPLVTVFVILLSGLSVACAFTTAWFNDYRAFILRMFLDMEMLQNYVRQIFFATHVRMAAWLIGIFVGYVLFKTKKKSPIPWFLETFFWICSISGIFAVIYWIYPFQQVLVTPGTGVQFVRDDPLQNALYIGFARYIMAICVGWIIYGCHTGSGMSLNWFLSMGFWMPISRMGLAIYLVSLSAVIVIIGSQKTPYVFDSLETWHMFNGDMVVVLIFASVLYLMLEAPIMALERTIYDIFAPKPKKVAPLPGTLGWHPDIEPEIVKPPPTRSWF